MDHNGHYTWVPGMSALMTMNDHPAKDWVWPNDHLGTDYAITLIRLWWNEVIRWAGMVARGSKPETSKRHISARSLERREAVLRGVCGLLVGFTQCCFVYSDRVRVPGQNQKDSFVQPWSWSKPEWAMVSNIPETNLPPWHFSGCGQISSQMQYTFRIGVVATCSWWFLKCRQRENVGLWQRYTMCYQVC